MDQRDFLEFSKRMSLRHRLHVVTTPFRIQEKVVMRPGQRSVEDRVEGILQIRLRQGFPHHQGPRHTPLPHGRREIVDSDGDSGVIETDLPQAPYGGEDE